jgi:hydroxymethylpyrimidine pyrophosphatase-like HAD family hydrolase
MVVYVDVDDTLVRTAGTKRIPMPRTIDRVRELHTDGHELYL